MIGKYYTIGSSSSSYDILGAYDLGNTSSDCVGGNEWILRHFGQCVSDSAQWASFILGFISLAIWFFPFIPQIYENYKRGSCEEALSPIFLFLCFFGDSSNLAGAVMTKQLPLQIYVGGYYIVQDVVILGQYVYYKVKNRRIRERHLLKEDVLPRSAILNGLVLTGIFLGSGSTFYLKRDAFTIRGDVDQGAFHSRVLLAPIFNGASDEIGYTFGSLSAVSYLAGRIPQLIKNYHRRSTEGVSLVMYALICLGNATYGSSVLLGCNGDQWTYYARHLPWLAGSLSCLFVDSLVFLQYLQYKKTKEDLLLIATNDSLDQSIDPSV